MNTHNNRQKGKEIIGLSPNLNMYFRLFDIVLSFKLDRKLK